MSQRQRSEALLFQESQLESLLVTVSIIIVGGLHQKASDSSVKEQLSQAALWHLSMREAAFSAR
jgi:hypothetical protein